jgi:ubiquinone/menaquinone biosynthesis C-methylase UbiE
MTDDQILKELQEFYKDTVVTDEGLLLDHLSNEVSLRSYIAKAREMARYLQPGASVLDWGAGFGQMTLILSRLGFKVTPFDVIVRRHNLFAQVGVELIQGEDLVILPFSDKAFDSVISCGVLEHVPDVSGSVSEVYRIIKPQGYFFIFNLPYLLSPSEFYASWKKISVHPFKFTKQGTKKLLGKSGFHMFKIGHENGFPKRLSGPLRKFRPFFNTHQTWLLRLDKVISATPLLRSVLSNSIKDIGLKP